MMNGVARAVLDKISLWTGDITNIEVDAIVNAANNGLRGGGGVDGAIHRAAGYSDLQKECQKIGWCDTGNSVITSGCKIKHIRNIIHTVGPRCTVVGQATTEEREKLISCYQSALNLAVKYNLQTIAFCCISTGVYGYPNQDAAKIVINFVTNWLSNEENRNKISRIVFCVFMPVDQESYQKYFDEYASSFDNSLDFGE
uniref:Macro domain-containing protein n=1 Tax=Heterorhabditis bacteriophora TaxID=37862 RepID=A0A1I7WMS5_HETBA